MKNKEKKRLRLSDFEKPIWAVISIIGFLIVWQLLTTYTPIKITTPKPLEVFKFLVWSLTHNIGQQTILGHILISIFRVLTGFAIGAVTGIILGISMGVNKYARAIIRPFFEVFRQIPPIAWIPMAILWFGIGEVPKVFIIFIGTFVNVTLNAYAGSSQVNPTLIGAAKMLGSNERDIFLHVILPASVPQIFNGMQVGFSVSWMGVLAAEIVSSFAGVGWVIIRGSDTANIPQVLAGMIAIGIVGLLLSSLMRYIEKRLTIWNSTGI